MSAYSASERILTLILFIGFSFALLQEPRRGQKVRRVHTSGAQGGPQQGGRREAQDCHRGCRWHCRARMNTFDSTIDRLDSRKNKRFILPRTDSPQHSVLYFIVHFLFIQIREEDAILALDASTRS